MPDTGFLALFLIGLLGGPHCAGMCGGIVGALSLGGPPRWSFHLAYNGGRLLSYMLAGALAGGLGALGLGLEAQWPVRSTLYVAANLMLIALGLYLAGLSGVLALTERLGQRLWVRLQPLGRRFLPVRRVTQAWVLGLIWGWLPCGLVYSALVSALTAGDAGRGAALMLAFGLGTLPNLLLAGLFAARLKDVLQRPGVRTAAGLIVLGFGLHGLYAVWTT